MATDDETMGEMNGGKETHARQINTTPQIRPARNKKIVGNGRKGDKKECGGTGATFQPENGRNISERQADDRAGGGSKGIAGTTPGMGRTRTRPSRQLSRTCHSNRDDKTMEWG